LSILSVARAKQKFSRNYQNKLLPILRVQPGFVDEIVLQSDVEPDRLLTFELLENAGTNGTL
jgi:hypothetical protein